MRQQPLVARACGYGEIDRRVIDPPPIVEMHVDDPSVSSDEVRALLRQPYWVLHCTLWDPVKDNNDTAMLDIGNGRQGRRLMGTLVASSFVGNDEHGNEGCFFVFPDLSVRTIGAYRLRFDLINPDPLHMAPGHRLPVKATIKSSLFHVYNTKDSGDMRASTELTKRLGEQGCLIFVKKGNAKSTRNSDVHEYEDDEPKEKRDTEVFHQEAPKSGDTDRDVIEKIEGRVVSTNLSHEENNQHPLLTMKHVNMLGEHASESYQDTGASDHESLPDSSYQPSIFSIASEMSSISHLSAEEYVSAVAELVGLLLEDDVLRQLCQAAKDCPEIGADRFENNFRRLLKLLSADLAIESQCSLHTQAAKFVGTRAAFVASKIRQYFDPEDEGGDGQSIKIWLWSETLLRHPT